MEREERERQRERGGQGVIRESQEDRETQEERESQEDREGKEEGDTKSSIPEGMSKNQWKKMQRRKRYDEGRQEWRKRQREKEKEKKRKRREQGIVRDPPAKKQKMSDTTASAIRVAIDLGYQDLMTDLVGHLSTTYSCFAHLCVCYVLYTMC
jgi:hypothetical protein